MNDKKKALKKLIGIIAVEALLFALIVWFFDPFYQYHEPFADIPSVLHDRDNQMPGTIRNFSYDSVLVGSSVVENCDSTYLNEQYDAEFLKVIRASGSVADLLYYLEMAQKEHDLKRVVWGLDVFALQASAEVTLYGDDVPRYLHTTSVLDDIPYLLNKEVLLERIPYMLACASEDKYTGGQAYNWADDKTFGAAAMMRYYDKPKGLETVKQYQTFDREIIGQNVGMLEAQIKAHPDTQYTFFLPPYSMCWWDCAYINGVSDRDFYTLKHVMEVLLKHDNVKLYFFQNDKDIICNLDNYMDLIHYAPDINQYMLEEMADGSHLVTADNWETVLKDMRALVEDIRTDYIYHYYTKE